MIPAPQTRRKSTRMKREEEIQAGPGSPTSELCKPNAETRGAQRQTEHLEAHRESPLTQAEDRTISFRMAFSSLDILVLDTAPT